MKKLLLSALIPVVLPFIALAQTGNRSVLKVRLSDRTPLSVNIDGRHFEGNGSVLTVANIPAGPHRVEVFSEAGFGFRPHRVFTGTIRIAPRTVNTAIVDLYNRGIRLRTRPADEVAKEEN